MTTNLQKCQVAVLIGGNGSNLQALIDCSPADYKLVGVISHNPLAFGLERAKKANLPAYAASTESEILNILTHLKPNLICLAGFMRILSPEFIRAYPNQIINIHPSLLPKYPGLHTHRQVIANQDKEHGATVHWVNEELDAGPIIAQTKLKVEPEDTEESIKAKVLKLEHMLYPSVLNTLANQFQQNRTIKVNQ